MNYKRVSPKLLSVAFYPLLFFILSLVSNSPNTDNISISGFHIPVLSPTPTPPFEEIGDEYLESGDINNALEFYIKALEISPTNTELLKKLKRTLVYISDKPKLELADELYNQNKYDEALKLYMELLDNVSLQNKAKEGAIKTIIDSKRSWQIALETFTGDKLPGIIFEMASSLITSILWVCIIGLIFGVAINIRNERTYRLERAQGGKRKFIILPFTGPSNKDIIGIEGFVRIQLADWLYQAKVSIDISDDAKGIDQVELPEMSNRGIELLKWFLSIIKPVSSKTLISAILIDKTKIIFDDEEKLVT